MKTLRTTQRAVRRARPWVAAALCACALAVSVHAAAQGTPRFQDLVREAGEAYNANEPERAIAALDRAYRMRQVPILLFNIGRAHELAGRYRTAIEFYDRFLETNPPEEQATAARDARETARRALETRYGGSSAAPSGGSAEPSGSSGTSGAATPRESGGASSGASSGSGSSSSSASGRASGSGRANGSGHGAGADLVPPPPPRGRPFQPVHGVLIVGGGLALVGGVVLGALTLNAQDQWRGTIDPALRANFQDQGTSLAWGTNVALGVGLVAVVTGVVLYLAQNPNAPSDARVRAAARPPALLTW